jgi:hypothetical protein
LVRVRLKHDEIEYLSWRIVRRLQENKKVEFLCPNEEALGRVRHAIVEDLLVEDRLNREVDDILREHLNEMGREPVDQRRMFQLIKNKLARERNLIL